MLFFDRVKTGDVRPGDGGLDVTEDTMTEPVAIGGAAGGAVDVIEGLTAAEAAAFPAWRPLSRFEAAKFLGKSPYTLGTWASYGYGPKFKRDAGRCWYWLRDLAAWREAHRP